ncbi:hypothetical protein COCMIDRAFT_109701 [Bipolaris oryzae ATCC 44560]|uniref:Uncharacterized protein n=1 Tax=Bipolaris oryzae ATCC 44560 TaxID=930090 RepID=W6YLJ9_COCMI|nr:uncharacterized protein COCMIDRAFT_109701 [Bipolaris oryzae ATCC 44560]EUC40082.1 hypothetical protein COCMIDRAFT_109701 [Bipolaris oryzae ATCC 44560]
MTVDDSNPKFCTYCAVQAHRSPLKVHSTQSSKQPKSDHLPTQPHLYFPPEHPPPLPPIKTPTKTKIQTTQNTTQKPFTPSYPIHKRAHTQTLFASPSPSFPFIPRHFPFLPLPLPHATPIQSPTQLNPNQDPKILHLAANPPPEKPRDLKRALLHTHTHTHTHTRARRSRPENRLILDGWVRSCVCVCVCVPPPPPSPRAARTTSPT